MTRLANLHSIKWWGEEGGSLQLCLPTSELQLNRNISGKEGYVAIPEAEGTKPGQAAMNAAQRGASWVTLPTMHLCTLVQVRCFNIVHTARREHRVRFSSPRPSHAEPCRASPAWLGTFRADFPPRNQNRAADVASATERAGARRSHEDVGETIGSFRKFLTERSYCPCVRRTAVSREELPVTLQVAVSGSR